MKQKRFIQYYKNYIVLFACIMFLFTILQMLNRTTTIYIDCFGKIEKAKNDILIKQNNEYYLSYEYVKENIDNEIYFDNLSRKVVISSTNGLFKIKVNEENINIDFDSRKIKNKGVIEKEEKYISLEVLTQAYSIESTISNNTIYLYDNSSCVGKTNKNNISLYRENNIKSRIVDYVDKKDKINVISECGKFVLVKVNDKKVGYVLKNALKYSTLQAEQETEELKNKVYFFADANYEYKNIGLDIDGIMVSMFSITQLSGEIIENNIDKEKINNIGTNVYGILDNGYELAGFNTTTVSQILSDEAKRLNLINKLTEKIEKYNLQGIVLDFRNLKEKDIPNFIQLIKELKAFSKRKIIVNITPSDNNLYRTVINYTDFTIVNVYGQRDLKSNVAGSISEISWMQEIIDKYLEIALKEKIVIGIPAYSILWTEKNSNVVDSDVYNLKAIEDYIKNNKLELKQINGQNYVELKKGSLTYRMWAEDEFSIKNRLKTINQKELLGICIYKLGYENESLINVLKNNY